VITEYEIHKIWTSLFSLYICVVCFRYLILRY